MDSLVPILQVQVFLHLSTASLSQFLPQSPYPFPSQGMSGMIPISMGNPFQRSMPMMSMPGQKMPTVVMPYHSKSSDKNHQSRRNKRRRSNRKHRKISSDSSDSSSSESDFRRYANSRRSNQLQSVGKQRQRQILTPIVSYITKDGYIVYQKKITKQNPKDWLDVGQGEKSLPASLEEIIDESQDDDRKVRIVKRTRTNARKATHTHLI